VIAVSPFSAPVLGGAALVSAPALWGAWVGTTSIQTALLRYLVCAALVWAGLAVVSMLVGPTPRKQAVVEVEASAAPAAPAARSAASSEDVAA
jgi:hypothetical protein